MGIIRPGANLNASFAAEMPVAGNLAFVSQSGAICTAILDLALKERIGFSHFVSIGSLLDVDFGDMIDYLGNDSFGEEHSVVYRKPDEFPQIHECRAVRVPDQTHHRSQIR
jgi:acyl-CoA synthetase (NDP forming)